MRRIALVALLILAGCRAPDACDSAMIDARPVYMAAGKCLGEADTNDTAEVGVCLAKAWNALELLGGAENVCSGEMLVRIQNDMALWSKQIFIMEMSQALNRGELDTEGKRELVEEIIEVDELRFELD